MNIEFLKKISKTIATPKYLSRIIVITLIIGAGVGGFLIAQKNKTPISETDFLKGARSVSFVVGTPKNTPKDDTVWIYIFQTPYKMEKVDDYTHRLVLTEAMLKAQDAPTHPGIMIRYRYSRNGYNFRTAEYLEPTTEEPDRDTDNYFWAKQGRETAWVPGKVQSDIIKRWRWFPEEGMSTRITALQPDRKFLPRISSVQFRSGQTIEDLYELAYRDFFDSTAQHMKKRGYTWAELDPPWQWAEEGGLPMIKNLSGTNPNYPDDETFLEELRAYKKAGLKVMIAPQVCCTPLNTKGRSREWWETYFDETEQFLVHFAKLAEQEKADAFLYAISSWEEFPPSINVEQKWRTIFASIRRVFSGEVGEMVWILGPEASTSPYPIPDAQFIKWGDTLDFIMVATEFPLSTKDNPSDNELERGAERVLDGVKILYDNFRKPIIIRNGYFNVKYSWKGQSFYHIDSIPWIGDPEAKLKESKYEFNSEDHARAVQAMFRAIAGRPWIIGYFHFGYTHWENPLSPWMSIRGKPAEDIWRKWNTLIYE